MGRAVSTEDIGPRKPSKLSAVGLLVAAAVLFTFALSIPHWPASKQGTALADKYGLQRELRGQVDLQIGVMHEGAVVEPSASRPVRRGDQLRVRFRGQGYLYFWLVEISQGGRVVALAPHGDHRAAYGLRAGPDVNSVTTAPVGEGNGPLVVYALFAAIPTKLDDIAAAAAAKATTSKDPEEIARGLEFSGLGVVRVLQRSTNP